MVVVNSDDVRLEAALQGRAQVTAFELDVFVVRQNVFFKGIAGDSSTVIESYNGICDLLQVIGTLGFGGNFFGGRLAGHDGDSGKLEKWKQIIATTAAFLAFSGAMFLLVKYS